MKRGQCPGCERYRGACICDSLTAAAVRAAKAAGLPDPSPQLCTVCRRGTVRGGVCPTPGCIVGSCESVRNGERVA